MRADYSLMEDEITRAQARRRAPRLVGPGADHTDLQRAAAVSRFDGVARDEQMARDYMGGGGATTSLAGPQMPGERLAESRAMAALVDSQRANLQYPAHVERDWGGKVHPVHCKMHYEAPAAHAEGVRRENGYIMPSERAQGDRYLNPSHKKTYAHDIRFDGTADAQDQHMRTSAYQFGPGGSVADAAAWKSSYQSNTLGEAVAMPNESAVGKRRHVKAPYDQAGPLAGGGSTGSLSALGGFGPLRPGEAVFRGGSGGAVRGAGNSGNLLAGLGASLVRQRDIKQRRAELQHSSKAEAGVRNEKWKEGGGAGASFAPFPNYCGHIPGRSVTRGPLSMPAHFGND